MKKKHFILTLIFLLFTFLLTGCGGTSDNEVVNNDSTTDGYLEVAVNWSELDNETLNALNNNSQLTAEDIKNPTHVGARVVYPDKNSDFKQMTTRETAENEGIITMKIPPGEAVLQVVVVYNNEEKYELATLISGAKLENMTIRGNQVKKISLTDLNLKPFETSWNETWENLFDENNHAVITGSEIQESDTFDRYNYSVEPTIEMVNPISSEEIPDNMKIRFMGTYEYKLLNTSEEEWTHDTFYGRGKSEAAAPIRVNNEKTKFVSKYSEESSTFNGWLSFELDYNDFNLPRGKYRPLSSPYHGLNDQVQPTEFSLEIQ